MVTQADIEKSLKELGLKAGDTVLFHSSLKSFGQVDGGADAVISAFLSTVTNEGTVVAPTLVQKEFDTAYETWSMDKPSDVGYITEVFRKMPEAKRSNQATHSVAAIGNKADYYTKTHGNSGLRVGVYGFSPFSKDSPWQKMYEDNAKVVMIGVDFEVLTFKHLYEYMIIEHCLDKAMERSEYDKYLQKVCTFDKRKQRDQYAWPSMNSKKMLEIAEKNGIISRVKCGNADLMLITAKDLGEAVLRDAYKNPDYWFGGVDWLKPTLDWIKSLLNK